MNSQRRESRQVKAKSRRTQDLAKSNRRRQIRRATAAQTAQATSLRRQVSESTGKLDADSAFDAVRSMGIPVDSKGNVDAVAARKVAEGAAISAARSLGVNIKKADGSIDTAKAREVISTTLGFSVERDGAMPQSEAAKRPQKAAEEAAQSILATANALGANPDSLEGNIRDANGNIDAAKAAQIADIALNLKVAEKRQMGRREALDALNASLATPDNPLDNPLSRRAASEIIEKLLSSSVLVDGKIDRRMALKALSTTITSG